MRRLTRKGKGSAEGDLYDNALERGRAIQYSRTREWLVLIGMLWSALASLVAIVTGFSARLRDGSERVAPNRVGPVVPYTAVALVLSSVLNLPLAYYSGFVVEHRFNLSNHTRRTWLIDELKALGVALALGPLLAHGAYWIIRRYPQRWWAVLAGLTIPFSIVLTRLVPVFLLPLFNKFEPLRDRKLAKRLEALAAAQGVRVSSVMQMDMSKQTRKANAFFTGIGKSKRIVLGDTMLDEFTSDELEIVLAHELGHQVHRDLWKLIGLGAVVSLANFYLIAHIATPVIQRWGRRWGFHVDRGVEDVAALPLLSLMGTGVSLLLTPVLNGVSRRWIEHAADQYALILTGKQAAFVSAMRKLGRMNLADPNPPALVKHLLYDHPPLQERIDFGLNYRKDGKR